VLTAIRQGRRASEDCAMTCDTQRTVTIGRKYVKK
jgi:hypothetical protein